MHWRLRGSVRCRCAVLYNVRVDHLRHSARLADHRSRNRAHPFHVFIVGDDEHVLSRVAFDDEALNGVRGAEGDR